MPSVQRLIPAEILHCYYLIVLLGAGLAIATTTITASSSIVNIVGRAKTLLAFNSVEPFRHNTQYFNLPLRSLIDSWAVKHGRLGDFCKLVNIGLNTRPCFVLCLVLPIRNCPITHTIAQLSIGLLRQDSRVARVANYVVVVCEARAAVVA